MSALSSGPASGPLLCYNEDFLGRDRRSEVRECHIMLQSTTVGISLQQKRQVW